MEHEGEGGGGGLCWRTCSSMSTMEPLALPVPASVVTCSFPWKHLVMMEDALRLPPVRSMWRVLSSQLPNSIGSLYKYMQWISNTKGLAGQYENLWHWVLQGRCLKEGGGGSFPPACQ